ncbi:MAG: recombination protein O N-terminal domain-containing protein [bacterium]
MRHKYETRGIVLSRTTSGEANAFVTILTADIGLVRARAQGVRRPGAKLSAALATFTESELTLVRGRESWRVTGAVLKENWFMRMNDSSSRVIAARVSGLLLRLVAGEVHDHKLFPIIVDFFKALAELPKNVHNATEILVILRILAVLGLDSGEIPNNASAFALELLSEIIKNRKKYITRINQGIEASGL